MLELTFHLIYLAISIGITVWVGYSLHHNGRLFLVDAFKGKEEIADAVNNFLLTGYYALNIGFVAIAVNLNAPPRDIAHAIEQLSQKVGAVMLTLGAMHFFNMFVATRVGSLSALTSGNSNLVEVLFKKTVP